MSSINAVAPDNAIDTPYPAAAIGWYTTILLALLYWLSLLDRTIISLLVAPIQKDLGISDVQFGMLSGLAFAVTFTCFGLVMGTFADRFNRRLLIFASVSIWSLATAACGMAHNFWHLLIARVGVGAGEAGLNPCATSMITDLFPPSKLTTAMVVYSLGASVGTGCAYLFGGLLVDLVAEAEVMTLPLIGQISSWQAVFYIIGIPGIFIAFLTFTMPEPKRRGVRQAKQATPLGRSVVEGYADLFKFMGMRKKFFIFHYTGFGLASLIFSGAGAWYPAHMGRTFGWDAGQIGLWLGIATVFGGILGKLLCGIVVDALYKRGYRDAQFRWYAGCLFVAVPVGIIATTTDNSLIFLCGIGGFMVLLSPLTAVYVASLNLVTPNELRGTGVAFFSAAAGIIALSLGPILIAAISDYVYGGNAIGQGIATLIAICCPLAAFALIAGCRYMREAVNEAELWSNS